MMQMAQIIRHIPAYEPHAAAMMILSVLFKRGGLQFDERPQEARITYAAVPTVALFGDGDGLGGMISFFPGILKS